MGKNKRQRVANGDKCFFSVYLLLETNNLETETKPKYPYDCIVSVMRVKRFRCLICLFDTIRLLTRKEEEEEEKSSF